MSTIVIAQVSTGTTIISSATTGIQGPAGPPVAVGVAGQFYVTNAAATLPEWKSLSGDVTDSAVTTGQITVVKVNGATAPAAGALTTGNVLQVSGVSALSYGAVNLAGGSNYVTGALPLTNLAQDAAATSQAMVWTGTQWAPGSVVSSGISPGTAWQGLTTKADASSSLWTTTPTADVVALYGADPTGVSDSSAAFNNAISALSGNGINMFVPAGTYKLSAQVKWQTGKPLNIRCAPGVTILANFVGDGTPAGGSLFLAPSLTPLSSTTLAAGNTLGTATISMTATPAVGNYVHITATAATFQQGLYKVTKVTGAGPYTVTLDRPVLYQFATSDDVKIYSDVNRGLHFYGNGCRFTGTTVRYFEFVQTWDSHVERVLCDAGSGAPTDMFGSFDVGSYRCRWIDCHADAMVSGTPATLASCAWALESAEGSGFERCSATNMNAYGYLFDDTRGCWALDCRASNCSFGLTVNADGNTIGSDDTKIIGGNYDGNVSDGIAILNGSSYTVVIGASANYNGGYGISTTTGANATAVASCELRNNNNAGIIVASGTTGTKVSNCDVSGSGATGTNAAFVAAGDVTVDGLTVVDTVGHAGSNRILVTAGRVILRGVELKNDQNTALNVVYLTGGTVDISGQILVGHNSNALSVGGATVYASNLKVGYASSSSGEIGFYTSAGMLRLGFGCDSTACALPILNSGGTFSMSQELGRYTNAATTGTVTLSQVDAKATAIRTTAALTGALTFNVPANVPGLVYDVENLTSNAFTVAVGVTGGTAVTIPQGYRAVVESDGTNMQLVSLGQTASAIQTDSSQSALTIGTNKTGAALVLQADAATTIQTIASTGTELANLSTPAAGTGPRTFGSSGRLGHVSSTGHITLLPGG